MNTGPYPMQPLAPPNTSGTRQPHDDINRIPEPQFQPVPYPWYKQRYKPTIIPKPSKEQIEKQPFRYAGWRSLSIWAGASDDTVVLRRFNALNARVIFFMQDEISRIESDLDALDHANIVETTPQIKHNGTFRRDPDGQRNELLGLLITKLKTYNDFVLSHRQLRGDPKAPTYAVQNLRNYLENHDHKSIDSAEAEFVNTAGDLVALVPKERPPLRRFLEKFASWHRIMFCCCFKENPTEAHHYQSQYDSTTTKYHDDAGIDALMTFIVTAVGLAALIGSLWVLKGQSTESSRLWTISGFLGGFTVFISVVTVAKPFESLAATAAVAAVLMVFMQLGPGSNNSCTGTQCSSVINSTISRLATEIVAYK